MDSSDQNYKQHIDELKSDVGDFMTKLFSIWNTLGFDASTIQSRLLTVKSHTQELFQDMITEEEKNQKVILTKIEEHMKTLIILEKELDDHSPSTSYESLAPVVQVQFLSKRIDELTKQKDIFIQEYAKLDDLNKKFALLLGLEPFTKYEGLIPTKTYLKQLSNRVKCRKEEYQKLSDHFESLKKEATNLIKELEIDTPSEFINCSESSADFKIVIELGKILNNLKEQKERAEIKSKMLKEEIDCLWVRLKEPVEQKEYFLTLGYGARSLNELNVELERLNKIKNERLQEFLKDIRDELLSWWDRCYYGSNQRSEFSAFSSDLLTNDLLDLHEMEIQRVRQHYDTNIAIYDMIAQREELWDRMIELEANAMDPKRFGNRGGQLLKEEKDRVKIQKQLPKLESQLGKLLEEYQNSNNGKEFIVQDEPLRIIIENQWEEFHSSKEQERQNRKIAKGSDTKVAAKRTAAGQGTHTDTKRYKMTPNPTRNPTARNLFDKTLAPVDNYERFQALSAKKQANSTMILNSATTKRKKNNENLPMTPLRAPRTPKGRTATPGRLTATPGRSPGKNTTMTPRLQTARRGKLPIII